MKIKYIVILLVVVLAMLLCSSPVLAWDMGLGLASDWPVDPWYEDINVGLWTK
jgi:hypothetical protein